MIIATVLRSSPEYTAERAQWLHSQLPVEIKTVCLSDINIPNVETVQLKYDWPGWWAKMELFDPTSEIGNEDILYLDLDTVIVGDISSFCTKRDFTALNDFFSNSNTGGNINSSIMYIPVEIKKYIWEKWIENPEYHMQDCNSPEKWGDQGFIGSIMAAKRWQDELPGMVVSYKQHIKKVKHHHPLVRKVRSFLRTLRGRPYTRNAPSGTGDIPDDARIVCFHGNPRPWDLNEQWILKHFNRDER